MTFVTVRCLYCDSEQVVKRGKTSRGKQRYLCQSTSCAKGSFLLDYREVTPRHTVGLSEPSIMVPSLPNPLIQRAIDYSRRAPFLP